MPKHSRRARALFTSFVVRRALATLTALSACSGGGDGSTSPPSTATVQSVTVSPGTATLRVGETLMLGAQVAVSNNAATSVTWTSEQAAIASVSSAGTVTALAPGTATIRATSTVDASRSGTATIVVQSTRSLTLTPATVSVRVGQQVAMGVVLHVEPGLPTTVTWRSTAPDIVSVDQSGVITGVAQGAAQITAIAVADTTLRASASVTVTPSVRAVVVTPGTTTLYPTQTLRFVATVDAEAGVPQTVTWRSANTAVATVTADGLVTALARGTTTLTAISTADTLQRGTATITVSPRLATEWRAARLQGALFEDVLSIHAIDATTVYAVNSLGDIFRWDGQSWSLSTTGGTHATRFVAVHGSGANNIIAVGLGGRIVRFNGTSWTTMPSGTTHDLLAVHVEGAGSAWAVGTGGVVLQLAGNEWTTQDARTPQDLFDVWAGDGVVYVVGNSGAVQRRAGGTWSSIDMPTSEPFSGVHGTSANDVVVVGREGAVLRWDGALWTTINTAIFPGGFFHVTGSAANGGRRYVVGDVGVAQLDGYSLVPVSTPYAPALYGISIDITGAVWAGGQRGAVMRSGAPWTTVNLAPDLLDVWSVSASTSFAVGEFGFVYQWNGREWSRVATPTQETLNSVWAADAAHAFAGGDQGTMLRWDGVSWSPMTFPAAGDVYGMWGSSATDVYAVTSRGEIMHWNGSAWSRAALAPSSLWAVHGTSAGSAIAVGEDGVVMRWNGTTWTQSATPNGGTLAGVWLGGPGNALVVGADPTGTHGVAWHFDGSQWRERAPGALPALTSVWGLSAQDVYATGDVGTLLQFDGQTWNVLQAGTTDLLWAISGAPDGLSGAIAVGYNSTVVTGVNPASTASRAMHMAAQRHAMRAEMRSGARIGVLEPQRGAVVRRGPLPVRDARGRPRR